MSFGQDAYLEYPYINIDADADADKNKIKLKDLFEYQDLEIPHPDDERAVPDKTYSILNIKKQFICVKFKKSAALGKIPEVYGSRIYVKKETINSNLPLIVRTEEKSKKFPEDSTIKFKVNSGIIELEYTDKTGKKDENCQLLFKAVYKQIENEDHKPYFADGTNAFLGGNKRGGTRKAGGSRSR